MEQDNNEEIITGVKVVDQMAKALEILNNVILPREKLVKETKQKKMLISLKLIGFQKKCLYICKKLKLWYTD